MIAGPGFWAREIAQAGWSRVMRPSASAFPETAGPGPVWGRNLYVRGGHRLIIEWCDPVTMAAVMINGREWRIDSVEDLTAIVVGGRG